MNDSPRLTAVSVARNLPCKTRDGTVLRADVYRPEGGGRYPVLLCRTPYDKSGNLYVKDAEAIAARGYIVAVQDARGRYASDGEYNWMFGWPGSRINGPDGYDAVEWAAALDGSDGQVGTWGNSYPSSLAWRLAGEQPPSLKAMYTSGMAMKHTEMCFGILETGRRLQWVHSMAADARRRAGDPFGPYTRADADDAWTRVDRGKWIWRLPLETIPKDVFSTLTPQLHTHFREVQDDYWAFDKVHPKVQVPVSCTTGWWDRLGGTTSNYAGIEANGPKSLRGRHRLVVGPWGHSTERWVGNLGPRDYGAAANASYPEQLTRYFDRELKGIANGLEREPPVSLFVLNDNVWRHEREWPLARTRYTDFFLGSAGKANTPAGDGALLAEPKPSDPDRYDYDPADPVMSLMGLDAQAAPCDQAILGRRRDVLVYQTPPLDRDLLVIGPVVCHLWAASDAPDTDFAAKLIEVGADGIAQNLCYGIMRARYRQGFDKQVLLDAGTPQEYVIPMMQVGIRFKKGSRIRLDIASSDFPNFDRNHNTGRDYWSDPELRVAHQTVFHDPRYPSRIVLPVIAD
ncbi:MAG: CocE/NonD family hydrolase [Alphaproteobacteria bacterium]|nr:CocE/NonD family hydrolase [Alphaproteobacteria bacterium]